MPFKDLPIGQTHYENDNCGIAEHNPKMKNKFNLCAQPLIKNVNVKSIILKAFLGAIRDDVLGIIDHTAPVFFTTSEKQNEQLGKNTKAATEIMNERLEAIEMNLDHYFFLLIEGTDKTKDGRQSIPYNSELFNKNN